MYANTGFLKNQEPSIFSSKVILQYFRAKPDIFAGLISIRPHFVFSMFLVIARVGFQKFRKKKQVHTTYMCTCMYAAHAAAARCVNQ